MTIYSVQFFAGSIPGNGTTELVTPVPGRVQIIRDIIVTPAGPEDPGWFRLYNNASGSPWLISLVDQPQHESFHWSGRQVMSGSQALRANTDAREWRVLISGYSLIA